MERKFRVYLCLIGGCTPRSIDYKDEYTLKDLQPVLKNINNKKYMSYEYREVLPDGSEKVVKFKKVKKETV